MQRRRRHVERTRTYYSWCTCVKRFVFRCRLKVGDRLAKSHVSRQRVPGGWSHCDRKVLQPGDASSRPGRWCRNEFEGIGGIGPTQKWGRGHRSSAKRRKYEFFGRAPPLLLALKVQLVVLVRAFVMVSTVGSVSCLLFFYSRCLLCLAICKSGVTRSPCLHYYRNKEIGRAEPGRWWIIVDHCGSSNSIQVIWPGAPWCSAATVCVLRLSDHKKNNYKQIHQ